MKAKNKVEKARAGLVTEVFFVHLCPLCISKEIISKEKDQNGNLRIVWSKDHRHSFKESDIDKADGGRVFTTAEGAVEALKQKVRNYKLTFRQTCKRDCAAVDAAVLRAVRLVKRNRW